MGFWDSVKKLLGVEDDKPNESQAPAQQGQPAAGGAPASHSASNTANPEGASSAGTANAGGSVYRTAPQKQHEPKLNPYGQSPVMGFSEGEVRKRFFALGRGGITPYFHPDLIPAPDDEFTQLVDRSLVLAGLLTQQELEAIHRTGLEWRKHRNKHEHARIVAKAKAGEAVQELRRRRAEHARITKQQAKERRKARREAIDKRRREDIIHLGRGVSGQLGDRRSHVEKLQAKRLPVMASPADVALALELEIGELRWLCFHEDASRVSHYHQFVIAKRNGGTRVLAAPLPRLKKAQRWIFDHILRKLDNEPAAHGFIRGRSTVSNAKAHVGQDVVINLDLSDFFPTVTFPRVRGLFRHLGYSPAVATILALLTTECPRRPMRYAGKRYHVAVADRSLPQGACTSPAIANQVSRRLDRRLTGLCDQLGWQYSRYADDLTFSAPKGKREQIPRLLGAVRRIVGDEGFSINRSKGRTQRRGGRQEVTGIVVNDKLGLTRKEVRRLRAIVHNAKKTGLAAQNRHNHPHFRAWLQGKLAYLAMIDRDKGMAMLKELEQIAN